MHLSRSSEDRAFIDLHEVPLTTGTRDGVALSAAGELALAGRGSGTFMSDWYEPARAFRRLVPSWIAETPAGTWIGVEMQARRAAGGVTRWWSFGNWASGDTDVRSSVAGQDDADGAIDVDTFRASAPMSAYRLRIVLSRKPGSTATAAVRRLRAVVSDASSIAAVSASWLGREVDLTVPRLLAGDPCRRAPRIRRRRRGLVQPDLDRHGRGVLGRGPGGSRPRLGRSGPRGRAGRCGRAMDL